MKLCSKCDMNKRKLGSSWCQYCINDNQRRDWSTWSHKRKREKWLKHKYGIDWNRYEQMHIDQHGKCAICRIDISILSTDNSHTTACVDHCHETSHIRGLLCNHCNRAIGLLHESELVASRLVIYLRGGGY